MALISKTGTYQEAPAQVFNQGLFEISSTKKHRLGTVRRLDDGRTFIYCKNGAAELAPGKLCCSEAPSAYLVDKAATAASALGSKTVTLTIGAVALTANELEDGFMVTSDATGEGRIYKIRGNTAFESSGSGSVYLYDAIRDVALVTTTSEVTLYKSRLEANIVHPAQTSLSATLTGWPQVTVTAEYYYWSLVKGYTSALIHGTIVAGNFVMASTTTSDEVAGAVEAVTEADYFGICGVAVHAPTDTEYGMILADVRGWC